MKTLKISFENNETLSKEGILELLREKTGIMNISYTDILFDEEEQVESITGYSASFTDFIFHLYVLEKKVYIDIHNMDLRYFSIMLLFVLIENGGEKLGKKQEFPSWVSRKWREIPFWQRWFIKK